MDKELKQTLLQGEHTKGPETYEKIFSVTSHQRDANQNHNEGSAHVLTHHGFGESSPGVPDTMET